mmetsp:Transcript_4274/g.9213  ORF Transcript_4274/g.9213 Transcript_4274/m.9213 type:complete len:80 (-) Transcript_4274:42-281(-)
MRVTLKVVWILLQWMIFLELLNNGHSIGSEAGSGFTLTLCFSSLGAIQIFREKADTTTNVLLKGCTQKIEYNGQMTMLR